MANNEQLSALMDGELDSRSRAALLDSVENDTELQDTWSRYHLIGDTMRGDLPDTMQFDLCDRIALALEDEPTVLAPQPEVAEPSRDSNVVPFIRRVGQQFGQYAIAASVAVAVIFGVQQYQQQDAVTPVSPVLNTIPVAGSASPVSVHYPKDDSRARQQALSDQQMNEQRERITAFLRDHQLQQRLHQAQQQVQE